MTDFCRLLEWDSQFFGRRIARVDSGRLDNRMLDEIFRWSKEQGINCLYFLCAPDDDESVALVEAANFHLVDLRLEYNWKVVETHQPSYAAIRQAGETDLPELRQIASQVYTSTRFFYDRHFDPNRAMELYAEWIAKSCRDQSQKVFVVQADQGIGGFVTCQIEGAGIGRIGLLAVKEEAQGKGYGQLLGQMAQHYFYGAGMNEVRVVTQGRNISAQRLYQTLGFRTHKLGLWYHKWFE